MLRLIPVILSAMLLGAHFLRQGLLWHLAAILASLGLLWTGQRFVVHVFRLALPAAGLWWVAEAVELTRLRLALGEPWLRMAFILAVVALLTMASSLVFRVPALLARFGENKSSAQASAAAFFLVGLTLGVVALQLPRPMLLAGRFSPGAQWLEILGLSTYAAFVAGRLLDFRHQSGTRRAVWLLFSLVFFAQLGLGLTVDARFLMSGDLHLPVPALIVAGPLYRGEGLFMPILFGVTVLFVGPAWCSHLCYIGALDHELSRRRKRPGTLPIWAGQARVGLLLAVIAVALLLRACAVAPLYAGAVAAGFGVLGLLVMLLVSSRLGLMAHCTVFCPMGLVAAVAGKLSPFRLRIQPSCTECGACSRACRYDALRPAHLAARTVGLSCTLCGDCAGTCPRDELHLSFFGLSLADSRGLFAVLAASLVAVFLGVARL